MKTDNLVLLNSDSSNGLRHGTFDSGRSGRIDSSSPSAESVDACVPGRRRPRDRRSCCSPDHETLTYGSTPSVTARRTGPPHRGAEDGTETVSYTHLRAHE